MHKLTVGDGYRYLTRQVAAGDAGLSAAESLTAYYEASGNPPGRWYGAGLAGLGNDAHRLHLGDVVAEEAMGAVFGQGLDPVTGEPLGRPYPRYEAAGNAPGKAAAADGELGKGSGKVPGKAAPVPEPVSKAGADDLRQAGGRARRAVVGFDLTFTAPKSVSVLWALGDEATRVALYEAHRAALAGALEFVEATVIRTRVGAAGRVQVATRGMVAAAFDHWDTRAGDPNLHTHVVVANRVQGPDGTWRSVDGRAVHAAAVTVSELYDTLLADETARRLPLVWGMRDRGPRRNPAFEITGIDDRLLKAFSSRSERIHEAEAEWVETFTAEHGRAPSRAETTKARQHLTRQTRPAKTVHPLKDLLAEWANRARALTGQEPRDLAAAAMHGSYGRALRAHDVGAEVREALLTQVIDDVSQRRSVWTTWNLAASALRASKPLRMATTTERLTLVNEITTAAQAACVHLDDERDTATRRVGENLYTTVELLGAEKVLIDAAGAGVPSMPAQRSAQPANPAVGQRFARLAEDQRAAVEAICTSPRALDVLVGPAGSGKTTALAALVAHWQATMGPVVALAPSASAAHTLGTAIAAPAETTAKWLHESIGDGAKHRAAAYAMTDRAMRAHLPPHQLTRLETRRKGLQATQDQWRFARGQLVIIDEASLADTRTLATLTLQARQVGAKVLLVGDHMQRGAVDAGGAFGMLARRGPVAELTSLWRFTHPWEARCTLELRRGHTTALDTYAQRGALKAGNLDDMLGAALAAAADASAKGKVAVLQAVDGRTVAELNARVRADRILLGRVTLHGGVTLHDGLVASVGDTVVTRRNNRRLTTGDGTFVRNGSLWEITAVLPDGGLLAQPAGLGARNGGRGAAVRLPAAYVAEHVELGYATTTARAQGITADESHTIATPGMSREDLYVAMTRGRHTNRTYVVVEHDDHDCEPAPGVARSAAASGRQILEQILATTHAERSATETWHDYHPHQPPPLPPARDPDRLGLRQPESRLRLAAPPTPTHDAPGITR